MMKGTEKSKGKMTRVMEERQMTKLKIQMKQTKSNSLPVQSRALQI